MVRLVLLALLAFSVSCRETIDGTDKLTAAERTALQQRAAAKCNAQFASAFANYQALSDDIFTSDSYTRLAGNGFFHEYKNGTTVKSSVSIQVWKQDRTNSIMYFLVNDSISGDKYFLRVKSSSNQQMISDLQSNFCDKEIFTSATGGADGPLSLSIPVYTDTNSDGTLDENTDSYSLVFSELAFLTKYRLNRSTIKRDVNGTQTGTANETSTLVTKAFAQFPTTAYATYASKFCEYTVGAESDFRLSSGQKGFVLDSCPPTIPTVVGDEWDLSI